MSTATLSHPAPATPVAATPAPLVGVASARVAAGALVVGAVLNLVEPTLQQIAGRTGGTTTDWFRLFDTAPGLSLASVLAGTLAVPFLLVGLQGVAARLRDAAPRTARAGGLLTLVGTLGFFGLHVLLLANLAAVDADRAAATAVLDHLRESPLVGLVVVLPFLVGMFGGVLTLAVGLLRTRVVPRWAAVLWLVFLPLDLAVGQATAVDPHWLFVLGAVGIARSLAAPRPAAQVA